MAKAMTVESVKAMKQPGLHKDKEPGLYLKIRHNKEGEVSQKSWLYRWKVPGTNKVREKGLGAAADVKPDQARQLARDAAKLVREGKNPIVEARQEATQKAVEQTAEEAKGTTFTKAAESYIASLVEPVRSAKQAGQWRASLRDHANPVIGAKLLDEITTADILAILRPIWKMPEDGGKLETATRVQQRLATIFDWAIHKGMRSDGMNPARWKGCLSYELPSAEDIRKKAGGRNSFDWMPYDQVKDFLIQLRKHHPGNAAKCLEFTILTGCRSGESRGARWEEIDWKNKAWTVAGARTKRRVPHRKPLSPAAIEVLKSQKGNHPVYIFPGERGDGSASNMAMSMLLRRMNINDVTVHGFRSSLRTWASEQTDYPRDLCEMVLHHKVKTEVEASYDKSDQFEKRAKLVNDWAAYLTKGN
jgi:integrase